MTPLTPLVSHAADALAMTRAMAYVVVAVGAAVLLYYLYDYLRSVLVEPAGRGFRYLGLGIAAGIVYGVAGVLDVLTAYGWPGLFADGATLFFILFLALGIRAMYFRGMGSDATRFLPVRVDYAVIAGFVAAWWLGYLLNHEWTRAVVAVGWIGASAWALYYSVLTVRKHEGTSFAAITRHLLPAIVIVAAVVSTDLVSRYAEGYASATGGVWIVGTVLVGAFLFNTAVAIRHQEGEVSRMYDPTTWRGESAVPGEGGAE